MLKLIEYKNYENLVIGDGVTDCCLFVDEDDVLRVVATCIETCLQNMESPREVSFDVIGDCSVADIKDNILSTIKKKLKELESLGFSSIHEFKKCNRVLEKGSFSYPIYNVIILNFSNDDSHYSNDTDELRTALKEVASICDRAGVYFICFTKANEVGNDILEAFGDRCRMTQYVS